MVTISSISLVSWTFFAGILATNILIQTPSTDNSDECDCYLTSGPDPGYFQYHRFFDFRDIPNDGANDFTEAPSLITNSQNQGAESTTSAFFNSTSWQDNWLLAGWTSNDSHAYVEQVASPQNIYISRNSTSGPESSTYLTMRTNRLPDFQSTAELESNQNNIYHSSIRARLRVLPSGLATSAPGFTDQTNDGCNSSHPVDPGAVLGFFTYQSDTAESDIEILTQDAISSIHYSNQPDFDYETDSPVSGASTQLSLPSDAVWTEWLDHRIDWYSGVSRWFMNDELVLNKTINVPTKPSRLILNLWSDGGDWSGNMSVGGQVVVGVEWIQMLFNVSGNLDGSATHGKRELEKRTSSQKCQVGCWVDQPNVQRVGFPEMAFNSTSGAHRVFEEEINSLKLVYGLVFISAIYGFLI